jgi:hypothetical protein
MARAISVADNLVERMVAEVSRGEVFARQIDEIQAQIRALSEAEIRDAATGMETRPMPKSSSPASRLLMNPLLAVQWRALFEALELPRTLTLYEPCAGSSEPVIVAGDAHCDGSADYTTLNLNRPLAAQLRPKLGKIRSRVRIVEEHAARASDYLAPGSVDVACFHHAINDLLQTAVAEPRGMDTSTVDWWPNERQMIEWLAEEYASDRLEGRGKPGLLAAVGEAVELTRPGGYLLFDHWTWWGHQEQEWFPWELFCDLIPLGREWISEADLPLEEITIHGRDPQWWMCFQKTA